MRTCIRCGLAVLVAMALQARSASADDHRPGPGDLNVSAASADLTAHALAIFGDNFGLHRSSASGRRPAG